MRLALFQELSPKQQKAETKKALLRIRKTQKMLEEKGTFTFYNPKKDGGLVMEYTPRRPIKL